MADSKAVTAGGTAAGNAMPGAPIQERESSAAPQERTALFGNVPAAAAASKAAQTKLFGDAPTAAAHEPTGIASQAALSAASAISQHGAEQEVQAAEALKRVLAFESAEKDSLAESARPTAKAGAAAEGMGKTALFGEAPADVQLAADELQAPLPPANSTQLFGQEAQKAPETRVETSAETSAGALLEASLFGVPPPNEAPAAEGSAALEAQLFGSSEAEVPGASADEALATVEASLFDLPLPTPAPATAGPLPDHPAAAEPAAPELLPAETSGIDDLFEDFEPSPTSAKEAAPGAQLLDEKVPAANGAVPQAGETAAPSPSAPTPTADAAATPATPDAGPDKPADATAPKTAQGHGGSAGTILFALATLALIAAIALAAFYEPVRSQVRQFFDQTFGHLLRDSRAHANLVIDSSTFTLAETKAGPKLLVFTCQVRNRGDRAEASRRVAVNLIGDKGVVAQTSAILGVSAEPEKLYEIADARALELLLQDQQKHGTAIEPGQSRQIVVIFHDYPDNLTGHRLAFHWGDGKAGQERAR